MVYIVPPSSALLGNCPQFESLNKKLTLSLLDHDGAVKAECLSNTQTEVVTSLLAFAYSLPRVSFVKCNILS